MAEQAIIERGFPHCPECFSRHIVIAGFSTFRWKRGDWVFELRSQTVADGATPHCGNCGLELYHEIFDAPTTTHKENE